ncbi:hydantoinase/oxoprolinase N-terminal domain-containing protein, partial [Phenylobacterium sp.]|uniref:hydantoinase/oxoprolinase N-terminal domain-containing protein n=1 Tax=Phenylobacterium sp. TaxID=1871053 RepID=UPI0037C6D226
MDRRFSFWIDRGGTFTDVICRSDDGVETSLKLLSASAAYPDAAVEAMRRLMDVAAGDRFPAARVDAIKMGTTVATNALLERRGARTLFVTTAGFGDALVIGDQSRQDLFVLNPRKPAPLYDGVVEAIERLAADGAPVLPLAGNDLRKQLEAAVGAGFT